MYATEELAACAVDCVSLRLGARAPNAGRPELEAWRPRLTQLAQHAEALLGQAEAHRAAAAAGGEPLATQESQADHELLGFETASVVDTVAERAAQAGGEAAVAGVAQGGARERERCAAAALRSARVAVLRAKRRRPDGGAAVDGDLEAARLRAEEVRKRVEAERRVWPARALAATAGVARADRVLQLLERRADLLVPPEVVGQAARIMALVGATAGGLWAEEDGVSRLDRARMLAGNALALDEPEASDAFVREARRATRRVGQAGGLASLPALGPEWGSGLREVGRLLGEVGKSASGASLGVEDGYLGGSNGHACWWDPPEGAVDGSGAPAARWVEPASQLELVPEHERPRMQRRQNLKMDRCRRSRALPALGADSVAMPPEDPAAMWLSEEAMTAGLRDMRAAEERVLGERLATSTILSMNSWLNMVEGVVRMFGTSLRVLTARGLPAELVVAVMLFLASPGAKRLMNEHWHRVRDAGRAGSRALLRGSRARFS